MNVIIIKGLKIDAAVGVTDAERDRRQRLEVDAVITPRETFAAVADQIGRTVDYQAAADRIASLARSRPRCLIVTLANDLAEI
jgi:dihydroneopterin aldolase